MSIGIDEQTGIADQIQTERFNNASKDGVLRVIKRNIQVLKQELGWGVKIDRSMLAEMEADYRKLELDQRSRKK